MAQGTLRSRTSQPARRSSPSAATRARSQRRTVEEMMANLRQGRLVEVQTFEQIVQFWLSQWAQPHGVVASKRGDIHPCATDRSDMRELLDCLKRRRRTNRATRHPLQELRAWVSQRTVRTNRVDQNRPVQHDHRPRPALSPRVHHAMLRGLAPPLGPRGALPRAPRDALPCCPDNARRSPRARAC